MTGPPSRPPFRPPSGALLVALILAGAVPASAQTSSVRAARLTADLTAGDGSAEVSVTYVVSGLRPGDRIPATALDFGGRVADLRVGGSGAAVALRTVPGSAWTTPLPVETQGSETVARARYRVAAAATQRNGAVRGRVPVLSAELLPERTFPGLFEAEVRLPPAWRVAEGFPTGLAPTGEPGVYRVSLPVVPSLVSFRARSDETWHPGLPLVLDALAVALLLAFSAVGLRHMRRAAG